MLVYSKFSRTTFGHAFACLNTDLTFIPEVIGYEMLGLI
jgi:hypothetical protein